MKALELTGKIFGKLTVLSKAETLKKQTRWLCKCECGNQKIIVGTHLTSHWKPTQSCGCLKKTHFVDLTGKKFGKLTLIKLLGKNKAKCWIYNVKCDCGNERIMEGNDVKSGKIKSCGCTTSDWVVKKCNENPTSSILKSHYQQYSCAAKKRGYSFSLTFDYFKQLLFNNCEYCGKSPSMIKKNTRIRTIAPNSFITVNGIDRINNNLGYEIGNVKTACRDCNQSKHQMTEDAFYDWVSRISTHLKSKGLIP